MRSASFRRGGARQAAALAMAMVAAMSQAVRDGKTEEVKKLLECDRGLLDTKDNQGAESLPPLLEAVRSNRVKVVKLLLEQGVDVNVADASGWTGLFYACNSGHETVLRMLLKAGADASIPTVSGWTPLMRAAYHGRTDFVRILLEHGSQGVNALSTQEENALWLAAKHGHLSVVSALLRDGGATPWIAKRYRQSLAVQNAVGRVRDCLDCIEWFAGEMERLYILIKTRRIVDERKVITRAPISSMARTATQIQRARWLAATDLTRTRVERGEELAAVVMAPRGGTGGPLGPASPTQQQPAGEQATGALGKHGMEHEEWDGKGSVVRGVLEMTLGALSGDSFRGLVQVMRLR